MICIFTPQRPRKCPKRLLFPIMCKVPGEGSTEVLPCLQCRIGAVTLSALGLSPCCPVSRALWLSMEVSFLLLKWDSFSDPPSFLHMWTQWFWEHLQYSEVFLGGGMGRCSGVEYNLCPTKPKDGDIEVNSPKISPLPDASKQIRLTLLLSALHASAR